LTRQDEHGSKVGYWVLAAAILILVLYLYGQTNTTFLYLLSNGLPPFIALLAFSAAGLTLRITWTNRADRSSKVWLGYTMGMLLWFLGETTWAVYSLVLGIPVPYPSVADVFWLVGYTPLLLALLFQIWPFREAFSTGRFAVLLAFTVVLMVLVLAILIPPSMEGEQATTTFLVSLAYPLLDVLLLGLAFLSFAFFMKGTLWRPMLFVTAGIILTTSADMLFSLAVLGGTYYNGHPLELLFHWSYLAFALGFYIQLKHAQRLGRPV